MEHMLPLLPKRMLIFFFSGAKPHWFLGIVQPSARQMTFFFAPFQCQKGRTCVSKAMLTGLIGAEFSIPTLLHITVF